MNITPLKTFVEIVDASILKSVAKKQKMFPVKSSKSETSFASISSMEKFQISEAANFYSNVFFLLSAEIPPWRI